MVVKLAVASRDWNWKGEEMKKNGLIALLANCGVLNTKNVLQ